ncbi:hypothetical protein AB2S62_22100 [Vibrio sp. NTOU-M3]|uniref:hypothetical protein n=1 Tax=Vibrio sp. NTOU-M3 TaxID=3234954 RepID=UPI0035A8A9DC
MKNRPFLKLALVLLFYIDVEVSFGTFTITYLTNVKYGDLGLISTTQIIAAYWFFMFIGRLLFVKFGQRLNSHTFLCSCLVAIAISIITLLFDHLWTGY